MFVFTTLNNNNDRQKQKMDEHKAHPIYHLSQKQT